MTEKTPSPPWAPKNQETLYGSSVLPSLVEIADRSVQLGEIVAAAHAFSGLSLTDWNALPEPEREQKLSAQIQMMQLQAPPKLLENGDANQGSAGERDSDTQAQPISFEDQMEDAEEEVEFCRIRKDAALQAFAQATQKLDRLIEAQAVVGKRDTLQTHLSGYFQTQAVLREARAKQMERVKGIKISDIFPQGAPIDRAMARKNSRGSQRPVVTIKDS